MFNSDFMRGFYTCAFRGYDVGIACTRVQCSFRIWFRVDMMTIIITMAEMKRGMWVEMWAFQSFVIFCVCIIFHIRWICRRCTITSLIPNGVSFLHRCALHLALIRCGNVLTSGKCLDLKINLYFSFESHTTRTAVKSPKSSALIEIVYSHSEINVPHSLPSSYEQFADCTENGAQPFYDARKIDI